MEPVDYIVAVKRSWRVIALLTLLGIAAGLLAGFTESPSYRAKSSLLLVPSTSVPDTELGQVNSFMNGQIQSYAQLASSPMVLEAVIADSSLPFSVKDLSEQVSAEVPIDTLIIEVSAVGSDPVQAADIANLTSRHLAEAVSQVAPRNEPESPVVELRTMGVATPPEYPESPNKRLRLAAGAAVGLFLGILIAVARQGVTSRRIKDEALFS